MSSNIVVTGLGIISSIGNDIPETFDSLVNQCSGIGPITILDTIHKNDFVLGEIQLSNEELEKLAGDLPEKPYTRTALLAIIAARQAAKDANILAENSARTGLVSATTVGGMDRSELYYKDFLNKNEPHPFIDTHHAGNSTEMVAESLEIDGYITTISTACSSSLNTIMFGARLIQNGIVDRAVVGGTDALSKFTLNGFNTLMILDKNHCRPFDASRTGLNLGEGAAYIVLEKEEDAVKAGKHIYAELSGYANANDAFHQTASSEEGTGPYLAMERALNMAKLTPEQIDYINVHGTGTDNNDLTEGRAMLRLFNGKVPSFSSTKACTGHTLGAAGTVESIIAMLAMSNNKVFPNINFKTPIDGLDLIPETRVIDKEIQHVLTNSFGFGGNDSSVVFSKYETPEPGDGNRELTEDSLSKKSKAQKSTSTQPVYINGMGAVAPQETLIADQFLTSPTEAEENYLTIIKPNYRDFINPKSLRRMSKIVRMGIVAAKTALAEADTENPDAIITATGMGCQADTEKFLNGMIDNRETLLNPTSFIQSTHNTIGAQIALMDSNHNYNFAYVHRTFSFESALLDSLLQFEEASVNSILLGGVDEITEESWLIKTRIGYFKNYPTNNLQLLADKKEGALAGESAAFFVLSNTKTAQSYAIIKGVQTFFRPLQLNSIVTKITSFLQKHEMTINDIDLVLMGYNGDRDFDMIYDQISEQLFTNNNIGYYKHLCGEHDTSSAFATWIAAKILKTGEVPDILFKQKANGDSPKRILIYNQFRNINHSLILLEKA